MKKINIILITKLIWSIFITCIFIYLIVWQHWSAWWIFLYLVLLDGVHIELRSNHEKT